MAGKITYFVGPSSISQEGIADMLENGWLLAGRAIPPPVGETTPKPLEGYALVFQDYFSCGLHFPCGSFLSTVLEAFDAQIHHLTPNAFLTLSKFCWACESYGATPDIDTFCTYFELQKQPKKFTLDGSKDGEKVVAQYDSCTFMTKRFQGKEKLELSWC
jgi:hypothetical protein